MQKMKKATIETDGKWVDKLTNKKTNQLI